MIAPLQIHLIFKIIQVTENTHMYAAARAIGCRKAINGLASLTVEQFEMVPNDGSVYVFYNRAADRLLTLPKW